MTTPSDLLHEFAIWIKPRAPRNWHDAAPRMRELVVEFLAERYPQESGERLATLAAEHVTNHGQRLTVDMNTIAAALAN